MSLPDLPEIGFIDVDAADANKKKPGAKPVEV